MDASQKLYWVKEVRHKRVYTVDSEIGSSNLWGRATSCAAVHRVAKSQRWLSDWTELNWIYEEKKSEAVLLGWGHGYT